MPREECGAEVGRRRLHPALFLHEDVVLARRTVQRVGVCPLHRLQCPVEAIAFDGTQLTVLLAHARRPHFRHAYLGDGRGAIGASVGRRRRRQRTRFAAVDGREPRVLFVRQRQRVRVRLPLVLHRLQDLHLLLRVGLALRLAFVSALVAGSRTRTSGIRNTAEEEKNDNNPIHYPGW